MYIMETIEPYDQLFSLGYRCSSAGILKSLGWKHESYPFDWLVSRLPIVEHCIQTEFCEFLNPHNYKNKTCTTNNYTSIIPSSRQWICNESVCLNEYYEQKHQYSDNMKYYLPQPVSTKHDAYGYKLMMNHRNIETSSTQEYYARCVERFNIPYKKRLGLYIHPAMFYEEFTQNRNDIIYELNRAHKSISTTHPHDGIYIIPVKTPFEYPTNHCCKYVLEEQPDDITFSRQEPCSAARCALYIANPRCRICILWTNRDFIDAGEIFMGNSYVETYVIKEYLQKTVDNKNLLKNTANL